MLSLDVVDDVASVDALSTAVETTPQTTHFFVVVVGVGVGFRRSGWMDGMLRIGLSDWKCCSCCCLC